MNNAEIVDDNMPPLDNVIDQVEQLTDTQEGSAPLAVDEQGVDNTQKRINKITAEKYAERRKNEELQRIIDGLNAKQKPVEVKAPTIEDFDYDESAYNAASISYQVKEGIAAEGQRLQKQSSDTQMEAANQQRAQAFDSQVAEITLQHPDYQEKIKNLPRFSQDTLDAIMGSDKGAQIALALSEQLDLADEIANSSPMVAAMKLGELSARLNSPKPKIKSSTAPSPIEPISSGGSISKNMSEMSMEEIYNS
tara:strand:- start:3356 stop:4108 length:753 start_codon:yes stop_codon:yes gene_type:complete